MPNVMILCRKGGGQVRPAQVIVGVGEKVTFKSVRTDATLFFPDPNVFGKQSERLDQSNKWEITLTVGKVNRDVYPYAVYCDAINDFAEGNSSPEMIIQ